MPAGYLFTLQEQTVIIYLTGTDSNQVPSLCISKSCALLAIVKFLLLNI